MKPVGLRMKLIALIVLAFLPLVWLSSHQAHKQRAQDTKGLEDSIFRVARLVTANRLQYLQSTRLMLTALAHTEGVIDPAKHNCGPLVKQLREASRTRLNIGACDMSGRVFCSALPLPPDMNLAGFEAVQRAWAIGDMAVDKVREEGAGRTLLFAYPVRNDAGGLTGAVFVILDLLQVSWFRSTEYTLPEEATISVIGVDGRYVFHSREPETNVGKPSGRENLIQAIPQGKDEGFFTISRDGRKYLSVLERLGPLSDGTVFYVNAEVDLAVVDAAVTQRWKEELWMIALIAAGASGAAWLLGSFWIVNPARSLVRVAREISHGNLDVRSRLNASGGEFCEIGAAFNQMTDHLSQRIADLDRTRQELQRIRGELEERVIERTEALQHSQELLVDAIENIDAGFAMFDANGILQACNELYRNSFGEKTAPLVQKGRSYKELLRFYVESGGTVDGVVPSPEWLQERHRYFLEGEGGPVEERLIDQWIRVSIHKMRDGGRVVLITDINSLKEAQEDLLLSNRAIAALNSGVLMTDPRQPDNPIVDCNPAFEHITGYSKAEVLGKNCRILAGPGTDKETVATLREAISEEREIQVVLRNYRKDGTPFWNELKISPVRDERGMLIHFVGVLIDVTQREEAAAALKRTAKELQRSNHELEEFAYVASHDLQEPLRMVASYTQLLARRYRDKLDDDARDFIEHAVNGARRMQAFIEDLLKYSRVGTMKRPFEKVDLNELVRDGLENFSLTMEEIGGEVDVGPLPELYGDKVQLWQLFQNLISNAVKFRSTERPLRVEIKAKRRGNGWEFTVRDNGLGFNQEDAGKIFEIFYRLKTDKEAKGTGMGLVICKKIVERHGGKIWAESEIGKGSTFYFTLDPAPADLGNAHEFAEAI